MATLDEVVDLVAAFLRDKEPLASVARFARCSCHFSSYLVASEVLLEDACEFCRCDIKCRVEAHRHVAPGYVLYEGSSPGGGPASSYVWETTTGCLACSQCLGYITVPFPDVAVRVLSKKEFTGMFELDLSVRASASRLPRRPSPPRR